MYDEATATSWGHLQHLLFEDPWPDRAGRFHSSLVHRGMCRSSWHLESSLKRRGLIHLERHLVRNFRKYAQLPTVKDLGSWDWLVLAQHHGLPTRLLDWTYSPYVALHFATDSDEHSAEDGVVWSIDFHALHSKLPRPMARALEREGSAAFTTSMLDAVQPDPFKETRRQWAVVFEPPSLDERVVNQYAGMSVTSRPDVLLDEVLSAHPTTIARKTVIPARMKAVVRERLDQGGITERVIYPGLDGLSTWLTRYYSTPDRATWRLPDDGLGEHV